MEPGVRLWSEGIPLESLRFAGANRLLVEFSYHGKSRLVEPYSLRRAGTGNLLLYAYELSSQQVKAFKVPEIVGMRVTESSFTPRYTIELGLISAVSESPTSPRLRRPRASAIRRSSYRAGPVYQIACPVC
ncbi:MAG: hypothetical protein ACT4P7_18420, partial [Gemmatimonadaceae bacterium]